MFILKPSRLWFVEIYMGLLRLLYIMDQIYFELIKYNHQLERWYYGHFHESATTHIGKYPLISLYSARPFTVSRYF